VYEGVRAQFSEEEIKTLTLAVAMINMWNRLNVAPRTVPGLSRNATFSLLLGWRSGGSRSGRSRPLACRGRFISTSAGEHV
jgi:hypothetical protein